MSTDRFPDAAPFETPVDATGPLGGSVPPPVPTPWVTKPKRNPWAVVGVALAIVLLVLGLAVVAFFLMILVAINGIGGNK